VAASEQERDQARAHVAGAAGEEDVAWRHAKMGADGLMEHKEKRGGAKDAEKRRAPEITSYPTAI
jgi:hypothetical protein